MQSDSIDRLLQLAWLEAWVHTHGAYENKIAKLNHCDPVPSRDALVARLVAALDVLKPPAPITVGSMLRALRSDQRLRMEEVFLRIGVSRNIYRLIEQDAISPLKISLDVWKRMMRFLNLSLEDFTALLRRTHQLVFYRPSFKNVLARYRSRHAGKKRQEMEEAYAELYAKAILPIPKSEEKKLEELIEDLSHG